LRITDKICRILLFMVRVFSKDLLWSKLYFWFITKSLEKLFFSGDHLLISLQMSKSVLCVSSNRVLSSIFS
jgi:hypothetical protein